ncbi:hypothetical protein ABKA04_002868 [Annulohypoxylon sp. FPYF3050]
MPQGNSYEQLPPVMKPYTIYLALHQRRGDLLGDFDWTIVMTLDENRTLKYRATNTYEQGTVVGEWHTEWTTPSWWAPEISKSLLCMFEINVCGTPNAMDTQKARIFATGHELVAAATTEQAAGTNSQLLESCATEAANWTRIRAREEGKLMTAGWFKIFKMGTPL